MSECSARRHAPHVERRRSILLAGLDIASMSGVEIGPLHSPLVDRSEGRIIYVDHMTTDGLRQKYAKYPDVDVASIVPVDIVWGDAALPDLIGNHSIDYVIASHVAEHVPDLITWLQEIEGVLKPAGQLRVLLPDKRVSFDALREDTRIVDLLDAYLHRARKPRTRQLLDCALFVAKDVDPLKLYRGELLPEGLSRAHTYESAIAIARDALQCDKYVDVHCWVFSPRSFAAAMQSLVKCGLVDLGCAGFSDSDGDSFEFAVFLQPSTDRAEAIASWRHMEETAHPEIPGSYGELEQRRQHESADAVQRELEDLRAAVAALRLEREIILSSTSWRVGASLRALAGTIPPQARRWLRRWL